MSIPLTSSRKSTAAVAWPASWASIAVGTKTAVSRIADSEMGWDEPRCDPASMSNGQNSEPTTAATPAAVVGVSRLCSHVRHRMSCGGLLYRSGIIKHDGSADSMPHRAHRMSFELSKSTAASGAEGSISWAYPLHNSLMRLRGSCIRAGDHRRYLSAYRSALRRSSTGSAPTALAMAMNSATSTRRSKLSIR